MKNNSWVILHDVSTFSGVGYYSGLACRYLFSCVTSEQRLSPLPEGDMYFSNIGAFKITEDTRKYINGLFESLVIPWNARIAEKDLHDIKNIIKTHYTEEQYNFFCRAIDLNEYLFKNPADVNFKYALKCYCMKHPKLNAFLRWIKVSLGMSGQKNLTQEAGESKVKG